MLAQLYNVTHTPCSMSEQERNSIKTEATKHQEDADKKAKEEANKKAKEDADKKVNIDYNYCYVTSNSNNNSPKNKKFMNKVASTNKSIFHKYAKSFKIMKKMENTKRTIKQLILLRIAN